MSSPLVERPLLVSPSLAATLGLEAALLYQLLADCLPLLPCRAKNGVDWYLIDKAFLADQLPFWDSAELEQVLRTLNDQGLIIVGSALMSNASNIRFSLPERSQIKPVVAAGQPSPARGVETASASLPGAAQLLPADWRPDQASVDYLQRFNRVSPEFIRDILPEFIRHYRDSGEVRSSWGSVFSQFVSQRWKRLQYRQHEEAKTQAIAPDWLPSVDAVEILQRDGISANFIEDAVPEFILYWRERGTVDSNWNSRFLQHIRLQWSRYRNATDNENEVTPIPAGWQPSPEVFDILKMACIDANFARDQVAEFVLYWRDSGQAQRSWNTKFLQHVKYRWAQSHQLGTYDARQQQAPGAGKAATGFIAKHTDRSWAEGL